ncbi:MAG: hypothetical protein PF485_11955 [Bacteroidales bacterium]|jgi:Spy/CpxP family protein refolding chaperone|nr:hypothetical protein [Bacteroidales bacterium]
METKTKKTLFISTMILLIAINISALSTIYFHNRIQTKKFAEMKNMKDEVRIQGMHRFIKEELKLTDKQFEQFKEISRTNMRATHNITLKLNKKRNFMMNEIAKVNPDQESLDEIAKDIGLLHYELKKSTINHFLELKKICNNEQQEDLQKLFMHMTQDQDNLRKKPRKQGRNRNRNSHNN